MSCCCAVFPAGAACSVLWPGGAALWPRSSPSGGVPGLLQLRRSAGQRVPPPPTLFPCCPGWCCGWSGRGEGSLWPGCCPSGGCPPTSPSSSARRLATCCCPSGEPSPSPHFPQGMLCWCCGEHQKLSCLRPSAWCCSVANKSRRSMAVVTRTWVRSST